MKKILASLAAALCTAFAAPPAPAAVVITFTPASQHVDVGAPVHIDVSIAGLGNEILSAVDVNFLYDSNVLDWNIFSAVPVWNQLGFGWGIEPIWGFDAVNGNLGFQATSLTDDADIAAHQPDAFLMFSFDMHGRADGTTIFGLGPDPLFQRNFVGRDFQTLDVTVGSACVAVGTGSCQVPEPGSAALLALALGGLGWSMRRRHAG